MRESSEPDVLEVIRETNSIKAELYKAACEGLVDWAVALQAVTIAKSVGPFQYQIDSSGAIDMHNTNISVKIRPLLADRRQSNAS